MKNARKQNFIEITKTEFQRYETTPISDKKAIEIQNNLFGFLGLLSEWSEKERRTHA